LSILQVRVGEEERQRVPVAERVADRLAHWPARGVPALLDEEPGLEVVHHRLALRLPHLEVLGRAEQVRVERGAFDPVHVEDEVDHRLRDLGRGRLRVEEASTEMRQTAGALAPAGRSDLPSFTYSVFPSDSTNALDTPAR
jgi:hypothetical protein